MESRIEELLEAPYWIIDILPFQVPADSPGQYFAVEKYFLQDREGIKDRHIRLILKLNCYRDIHIADQETINPPPDEIAREMRERFLYLMTGGSMILSEPDDTHLTVFQPDEELLSLLRLLAPSEGLYVWQPPQP